MTAILLLGAIACGPSRGGGSEVSGTWDSVSGLDLRTGTSRLQVPVGARPSNPLLTLQELGGEPGDGPAGTDRGVSLGPDGTMFEAQVTVTIGLARPTTLTALPVLRYDETAATWVDTGVLGTVLEGGGAVVFPLDRFSAYRPWNPPLPPDPDPIDLPIAGSGSFEAGVDPTNPTVSVSAEAGRVSLVFSPFGDAFGLSQMGGEIGVSLGPVQGVQPNAAVTAWGLHASRVESIGNLKVGYVTPAGGLSGPSIYYTGGRPEGVSGIMFLSLQGQEWTVRVFCAYSGGTIVGVARGRLGT